jgi:hypothetical protein
MNPFQALKLYNQFNKATQIAKGMTMQNWLTTLLGILAGALTAASNYASPHPTWQGYVGAALVAAIGIAARDFNVTLTANEMQQVAKMVNSSLNKVGVFLFLFFLLPSLVHAQTVTAPPTAIPGQLQNLYAAGASYNPGGSPGVAGTALYAHNLNTGATLPTFAFTAVDALTTSTKPFTVTTNVGIGLAQQVATLGKIPIYMPTSAGISWSGPNTGWSWTGGVLTPIKYKSVYLIPAVRFLKSSVSNGSNYQVMASFLIGWGN